jgi:hypothetical protein
MRKLSRTEHFAWAPEDDCDNPENYNFGEYQGGTELWWQFHLNGDANAGRAMERLLNKSPWDTRYTSG